MYSYCYDLILRYLAERKKNIASDNTNNMIYYNTIIYLFNSDNITVVWYRRRLGSCCSCVVYRVTVGGGRKLWDRRRICHRGDRETRRDCYVYRDAGSGRADWLRRRRRRRVINRNEAARVYHRRDRLYLPTTTTTPPRKKWIKNALWC